MSLATASAKDTSAQLLDAGAVERGRSCFHLSCPGFAAKRKANMLDADAIERGRPSFQPTCHSFGTKQ